jgi:hypothetical protein
MATDHEKGSHSQPSHDAKGGQPSHQGTQQGSHESNTAQHDQGSGNQKARQEDTRGQNQPSRESQVKGSQQSHTGGQKK